MNIRTFFPGLLSAQPLWCQNGSFDLQLNTYWLSFSDGDRIVTEFSSDEIWADYLGWFQICPNLLTRWSGISYSIFYRLFLRLYITLSMFKIYILVQNVCICNLYLNWLILNYIYKLYFDTFVYIHKNYIYRLYNVTINSLWGLRGTLGKKHKRMVNTWVNTFSIMRI